MFQVQLVLEKIEIGKTYLYRLLILLLLFDFYFTNVISFA
ncbi:hypothetical protein SAMN04488541_101340 [Thermoflexibacter ruber]|uniref:Uncharacterized protein n=1 Tax=Thermoflexibacter ruber TaxID=1003 RepID=A0A1I2FAQ1_9BACT|nr:hypothetical protein SAMN04488541_101340 [Thermoflexibacter ruber]